MTTIFADKTILITGGTGSFGHELLWKILDGPFKEVRIFSRDELKQSIMRDELANPKVNFIIGDVRDKTAVDRAMDGVDLVFHAAALKQVPSCEFFPMEAVRTNIFGTSVVLDSAVANKVKKVICLSTDKAVYPVNAMGMTKALMEKTVRALTRRLGDRDIILCCVRYGNVMYSRGSVIPLFVKQIKNGNPITITDPSMTRFLLPLPDAVDLVLFAFKEAAQGDIFIKKSPACTVMDLATVLQEVFETEVPIKVIGMRHGEKLHETLATQEEIMHASDMGEFLQCRMDTRDLNYDKYLSEGNLAESSILDYTSENTYRLDKKELRTLLLAVPQLQEELGVS